MQEFQASVNAEKVKKDRLVASVVRAMKYKKMSDVRVVLEILQYSGTPIKYGWYIVKIIVLKNVYWHFYKEDRRVNL